MQNKAINCVTSPLCLSWMREPLDVDSDLMQAVNELCFMNSDIIRLPADRQALSASDFKCLPQRLI